VVKQLEETATYSCKATNVHMLWKVSLLSKAKQVPLGVGGKVSEWDTINIVERLVSRNLSSFYLSLTVLRCGSSKRIPGSKSF